MKILITNDDGYKSVGFLILFKKLSKKHDVSVCVPMYEKSGSSSSLTLFDEMKYKEIEGGYTVDATPADCVKMSLNGFFGEKKFDCVLSGINYGTNICSDMIYSGTVGAAREAVINNAIGIACSTGNYSVSSVIRFSDFLLKFLDNLNLLDVNNYKNYFFNINHPFNDYISFDFTVPGIKKYDDSVFITQHNDDKFVRLLLGTDFFIKNPGTDIYSLDNNNISVGVFEYKNSTFYPTIAIPNYNLFEEKLKDNI